MRPATLLARLRSQGTKVAVIGDRVSLERAEGPLPDDVLGQVRAAKADLLSLLRREAERVTPCPCGECREPGAAQHGPTCYCPSCIALDPELDVYRERADAREAAAKADAAFEAEERAAIRKEGCTPEELETIKEAKETAAAKAITDAENEGPPSEQRGPWRWTDPENTPEDLAILAAIDRLDREELSEKAVSSCYGCGGSDWWRARIGGHLVCRRCHGPVPGAEATP